MNNQATPKKLGRYEIVKELGKGAMGVVYEGKDPSIGRRVAIKTARRDMMERSGLAEEMLERFLREARAAGMLSHPHIITIYDVGEEEGIAYIAMEYVEGKDLDTLLDDQCRFSIEQAVEYGIQICEALHCAHTQGIVHRDVKPANIMIPTHGPLKVADFGIARTHDSTLTQDGALMGTPSYMSPEQFMGQKVDARADLFSVGIILYEMLTGEKPFTGEALTTIMHHILKSDPTPPIEFNYLIPEALNAVVMRALSKRPQNRYQDGKSMADALRESLKPNPNTNIINGCEPQIEKTLIAGAAQTGDSTPAAGSSSTVAMQVGAIPGISSSTQESTFSDANSIVQENPPSSPPPSTLGTVQGASSLFIPNEAASQPQVVASRPLKTSPARKYALATIGIVGVIFIFALLGAYLFFPSDNETVGARKTVNISVYETQDRELFKEYGRKSQLQEENLDIWVEEQVPNGLVSQSNQPGWTVQALHPDTKATYASGDLKDGYASLALPESATSILFEIIDSGNTLYSIEVPAPDCFIHQTFLLFNAPQ